LSAFFVAPYGQPYDFPVLLIPFLVLLERCRSEGSRTLMAMTVILVPYIHIYFAGHLTLWWLPPKPAHQVTFFWVPLLLAGLWLASGLRTGRPRLADPSP